MIRSILAALRLAAAPNAAFVTIGLFWGCWAAYVPAIKAGLGVGDGTFGLLLMGSACGLVSAMWIAPRVDRALGRRAMPTLAVLFVLAGLLPSLMGAPAAFLVSLFVVGLCSGLLDVSMNARVSELEAVHGRPLMNGSHAMFAVGYAISALVAGIEREAGLPPVAAQAVVAAAVILLLVPRMALEPRHVEAPQSGRGRYLLRLLLQGSADLYEWQSTPPAGKTLPTGPKALANGTWANVAGGSGQSRPPLTRPSGR